MIAADITDGRREGRGRRLSLPRTSRRMDLADTARALDFGSFASAAPGSLEVFVARAEARALLHAAGELTLHEAVDELQATAERDGLVAEMGQDEVQQMMAEAFAAVFTDPRETGEENSAVSENASDISGGVGERCAEPYAP